MALSDNKVEVFPKDTGLFTVQVTLQTVIVIVETIATVNITHVTTLLHGIHIAGRNTAWQHTGRLNLMVVTIFRIGASLYIVILFLLIQEIYAGFVKEDFTSCGPILSCEVLESFTSTMDTGIMTFYQAGHTTGRLTTHERGLPRYYFQYMTYVTFLVTPFYVMNHSQGIHHVYTRLTMVHFTLLLLLPVCKCCTVLACVPTLIVGFVCIGLYITHGIHMLCYKVNWLIITLCIWVRLTPPLFVEVHLRIGMSDDVCWLLKQITLATLFLGELESKTAAIDRFLITEVATLQERLDLDWYQ